MHSVLRPNYRRARALALIETVPGQVALEVFARKAGMTQAAMRAELLVNGPLAQYFCQIVAQSMEAA